MDDQTVGIIATLLLGAVIAFAWFEATRDDRKHAKWEREAQARAAQAEREEASTSYVPPPVKLGPKQMQAVNQFKAQRATGRLPKDLTFQALKFGETKTEALAALSKYELIRDDGPGVVLRGQIAGEGVHLILCFTATSGMLWAVRVLMVGASVGELSIKLNRYKTILVEKYGPPTRDSVPGDEYELEEQLADAGVAGYVWELNNGTITAGICENPMLGKLGVMVSYTAETYEEMDEAEKLELLKGSVGEV